MESTSNAVAAIQTASVREIEDRLDQITAEQRALRTLLRSLKARDRAKRIAAGSGAQ